MGTVKAKVRKYGDYYRVTHDGMGVATWRNTWEEAMDSANWWAAEWYALLTREGWYASIADDDDV